MPAVLVIALLLVAAVLFGHGAITESTAEVVIALALSIAAAALVVFGRVLRAPRTDDSDNADDDADADVDDVGADAESDDADAAEDAGPASEPDSGPDSGPDSESEVVFMVGRTAFHTPTCASVAGKQVSRAQRHELLAGGMTACRRCGA